MNVICTPINDVQIIKPDVHGDERGFFLETFQAERYKSVGIEHTFVQDNYSRSGKGVLRGLHLQKNKPQGKLVRVVRGKVLDVVVDCRKNSSTFGQWFAVELSEHCKKQLWIPPGLAHGFLSLSETTDIEYKCTDYYDPSDEICILWSDKTLNITWPKQPFVISEKDQKGLAFKALFP